MKPAELDAVVLDAYGTLMTLLDPVPTLVDLLAAHGVERSPERVLAGVRAEIAHYGPRASEGHDVESLARLQRECAGVFLAAVESNLDAGEFAPVYAGALRFEVLPGVLESLERLRALGLELAVVANWDLTLHERLEELGLRRYFSTVVHAARKPAPDGLLRALDQLGVDPARALYVGDSEADKEAARTAAMQFAPAPLPDAVAMLA
jgi:phosphoglycolate phosphatase-like HAD superfamily hydrolase